MLNLAPPVRIAKEIESACAVPSDGGSRSRRATRVGTGALAVARPAARGGGAMADWIQGNVVGAYEAYYHNINPEPFGELVRRHAARPLTEWQPGRPRRRLPSVAAWTPPAASEPRADHRCAGRRSRGSV
jgi:hypothetical protein